MRFVFGVAVSVIAAIVAGALLWRRLKQGPQTTRTWWDEIERWDTAEAGDDTVLRCERAGKWTTKGEQ